MIYTITATAHTPKGNLTVQVEGKSRFLALDLAQHYFRAAFQDDFEMTIDDSIEYKISKQVELENFCNGLDCLDVDYKAFSNEELIEMFEEHQEYLSNDDIYSNIYNEYLWEVLKNHKYVEET